MANQPRVARVLVILLISMTVCTTVLMLLSNNPPSAGPFCLASYYNLGSVEKAVISRAAQSSSRWNSIEVYYSTTKAGNIQQLASLAGLSSPDDLNCHFVICNGLGGRDGQIMPTEKWQRQWSVIPDHTWYGSVQTIRICVIANGRTSFCTDFQKKRTEAVVEHLFRKFSVKPDNVYFPTNW
ncbi:MAG: hypothetical protein ACYSSI_11090 [Planctomycetota bacterium]